MKFKIPILAHRDSKVALGLSAGKRIGMKLVRKAKLGAKAASIVVRGRDGASLAEKHNAEEADGTFFGRMKLGDPAGISRTFSIHNDGAAPLKLGRAAIEGTGADQFEVTAFPAPSVAPGASTSLTIRYHGRRPGSAIALVLIPSNDARQRPYLFLIEGEAHYL